jgi:precorrin-6B methylase 2
MTDKAEGRPDFGKTMPFSLLRPGDIFVDVGARIGYFSLLAGCLVGPTGKVFAFEADSEVFQRLRPVWQRTGHLTMSALAE